MMGDLTATNIKEESIRTILEGSRYCIGDIREKVYKIERFVYMGEKTTSAASSATEPDNTPDSMLAEVRLHYEELCKINIRLAELMSMIGM